MINVQSHKLRNFTGIFLIILALLPSGNTYANFFTADIIIDSGQICSFGIRTIKLHFANGVKQQLLNAKMIRIINKQVDTIRWFGLIDSFSFGTIELGKYTFKDPSIVYHTGIIFLEINGLKQPSTTDTLMRDIRMSLRGAYTVDNHPGAKADYTSLFWVAADLDLVGVCGAVTFNIADGRYNESIQLDKIPGSSLYNPVTFQSKSLDSTKVIIDATNTGLNAISMRGTTFLTIRKMTLYDPYYPVISTGDTVQNLLIEDNIIHVSKYSSDPVISFGGKADGITIKNNIIRGGYYGVQLGNYWGALAVSTYVTMLNNRIDSFSSVGINLGDVDNLQVSGNIITSARGLYAISYNQQNITNPVASLISNNMISMPKSGTLGIGVAGTNIKIYNNSIYTRSAGLSGLISAYNNGSGYMNIVNNILFNDSAFGPVTTRGKVESDYNDLYCSSGNFSLSAWQKQTGLDSHSISVDPGFINAASADLHLPLHVSAVAGHGIPLSGITTDIDGHPRPPVHPDIGADQLMYANLAAEAILSPLDGGCGDSSMAVMLRIGNVGLLPTDTFYLPVFVSGNNSGLGVSVFIGKLLPGHDTVFTIKLHPLINAYKGGSYKIVASVSGTNDLDLSNDTLKESITVLPRPDAGFIDTTISASIVQFIANDVSLQGYSWNFGDSSAVGSGYHPVHTYKSEGSYHISLTVTAANGCQAISNARLNVGTGIEDDPAIVFHINAFPNPFSTVTNITYTLPRALPVVVVAYDLLGRRVSTLTSEIQTGGAHALQFKPSAAGVYLLKIQIGERAIEKRVMMME